MAYQNFQVAKDFRVFIEAHEGFSLTPFEEDLVESIWEKEGRLKGGKLFNGQILSYGRHDYNGLYGYFIDYKHYIAALREPSLRAKISLKSLGVSGLTVSREAVLFGRRASFVTQFPSFYELAPSGGLNPEMAKGAEIPLKEPFLQELFEETGISPEKVKNIAILALVFDDETHLYEIVARLDLDASLKAAPLQPSDEYEELLWVEASAIDQFFQQKKSQILPMSEHVTSHFLLN